MRFAFALFKYFPFGGLQSDMLRIAECAAARGHEVTVFTGAWDLNLLAMNILLQVSTVL